MTSERKERSPDLSRTTQAAAARRAAALAGHSGDVDAAHRGLAHPWPEVRATALRALTRLDRATPDVVRAAAGDADPLVRVAACEAALQLPASDAVAVVGPLLDDDVSSSEEDASSPEQVASSSEEDASSPEQVASSPEEDVTSVIEAAAFAAGELGAEAGPLIPRITKLMGHADTIVRETAVAALGAIGDPAALPTILAATKDRATVRHHAIIALAPFEGTDVDEALSAALHDRDWQVRQAAEDQTERHEETP